MLNQIVLVGRLANEPTIKENGECIVTLAVPRTYKNQDGEYETDFIPCVLFKNIAETTREYCKKGDVIGIRGRIQTSENEIVLVAEKVTFLSSSRKDED